MRCEPGISSELLDATVFLIFQKAKTLTFAENLAENDLWLCLGTFVVKEPADD
jgi:hypothetical protein